MDVSQSQESPFESHPHTGRTQATFAPSQLEYNCGNGEPAHPVLRVPRALGLESHAWPQVLALYFSR